MDNVGFRNAMQEVEVVLQSSCPLLWVRTFEETRFIEAVMNGVAEKQKRDVYVWSLAQGIVPAINYDSCEKATGIFDKTDDPRLAIRKIIELQKKTSTKGNIVIMRDPGLAMQEPIPRMLRDAYSKLTRNRTSIIFLSPTLTHGPGGANHGIFPSLEKQISVVDFELPDLKEIDQILRDLIRKTVRWNTPKADASAEEKAKKAKIRESLRYSEKEYFEFGRALQGLTDTEILSAATSCLHHCRGLDVNFLLQSKKHLVNKSEILEYHERNKPMTDIGGLDLAKAFFDDYKFAHSEEAQKFGVEPLRGILLVGVPGTGKSQIAKAVASEWQLPLLRLDVGKVMTGRVGGSEAKMREVIKQTESMAPAVLWVDEIEKALSGTKSSNFSDGGTMARVFGTLLTAMEEGLKGITIVATANDISALPPELIRRFSEVFFVDLPGPSERTEIFNIHLKNRDFDPEKLKLDIPLLVETSDNYTGHEIEKAIQRSLALAFKSKKKELTTEHILAALQETKPISHIMGDKIDKMRREARGKFRYASSWAASQSESQQAKQKKMSLDELELPPTESRKPGNDGEDGAELDLD